MDITRLIDKATTLVLPLTVIVCSIFAAQMVNDFVEAKYIGEAKASSPPPTVEVERSAPIARSKSGAALTSRNMFCAECETSSHQPAIAVASAGEGVPDTMLPLTLITTNVSTDPSSSFASLVNTSTGHKGAFWSGQPIPGAGPIERIAGRFIDFRNTSNNRIERLRLDRPAAAATPTPTTGRRVSARTPAGNLAQEIEEKVRKVNDTTWELDRTILQTFMSNPRAQRGVRVIPALKNGKIGGFKVSSLSSRSPIAKIGIKRGDIIRSANGVELTGPDVVLGFASQVQSLNRVSITVERGGKNVNLSYLLR